MLFRLFVVVMLLATTAQEASAEDPRVMLVGDLDPRAAPVGSRPAYFAELGNTVYFRAETALLGAELWKSERGSGVATLVKDIAPGRDGSGPNRLTAYQGRIWFATQSGPLWSTDGTEGAQSNFEHASVGNVFGTYSFSTSRGYDTERQPIFRMARYRLLRCATCLHGGMSHTVYTEAEGGGGFQSAEELANFWPASLEPQKLPEGVPKDIVAEFREAELCMAHGARRGAAALFRSVLERALKANGYRKLNGNGFDQMRLSEKISLAAEDGVITLARKKLADTNIRVLGNDVVHDDYRPIDEDEIADSQNYAQRILEDLYDDRETVVAMLKEAKRQPAE